MIRKKRRLTVYPRVCGGTDIHSLLYRLRHGLSPRVRGNRRRRHRGIATGGSIPACAGEPKQISMTAEGERVYPRVCGGTYGGSRNTPTGGGLSPRVRGNRTRRFLRKRRVGSIPACAGEPSSDVVVCELVWVYPRVCGGTGYWYRAFLCECGLSPRVRGNHAASAKAGCFRRSIPACAGEPNPQIVGCENRTVYPRVCGGT